MKMHLRLLAVAVAMAVVWSSSPTLAAPPAKGVIAIVGAAHTHMKWYPMNINGNKNIRVKYVWDHNAERRNGVPSSFPAQRPSPMWMKFSTTRKLPAS